MTNVETIYDSLKYTLKIKTDKKTYYYYRADGLQRIPLPDPNRHTLQQCLDSYQTARENVQDQRQQTTDYYVGELIDIYKDEIYKPISDKSKKTYDHYLNKIKDEFDGTMVNAITNKQLRELINKQINTVSTELANHINRFFRWCRDNEFVKKLPAKIKIKPIRAAIGHNRWTEKDITNFRRKWPCGSWERLCMEVLLASGARAGDALNFDSSNLIQGNQLKYISGKTGVQVHIQLPKHVTALLFHVKHGWPLIYNSYKGDKIKYNTFYGRFRKACKAAGIKKTAHGLRKTFATRLAEQGKTEYEIMAAGGWKTPTVAALYVKEFERSQAGLQATLEIEANLKA